MSCAKHSARNQGQGTELYRGGPSLPELADPWGAEQETNEPSENGGIHALPGKFRMSQSRVMATQWGPHATLTGSRLGTSVCARIHSTSGNTVRIMTNTFLNVLVS